MRSCSRSFHRVLAYAFSGACVGCGRRTPDSFVIGTDLCLRCLFSMRRESAPRCVRCSTSLISEIDTCLRCRDRTYAFERNVSLFPFEGVARAVVLAYKSGGRKNLARFLGRVAYSTWKTEYAGIPVVPVPPRPAALRSRGWDPVDRVCRVLAQNGVPIERCLRRKNARAQKTLSIDERAVNMQGVFSATRTPPKRVVVFDDVFTTGSTVHNCAETLIDAGASTVYVLTLVRET